MCDNNFGLYATQSRRSIKRFQNKHNPSPYLSGSWPALLYDTDGDVRPKFLASCDPQAQTAIVMTMKDHLGRQMEKFAKSEIESFFTVVLILHIGLWANSDPVQIFNL